MDMDALSEKQLLALHLPQHAAATLSGDAAGSWIASLNKMLNEAKSTQARRPVLRLLEAAIRHCPDAFIAQHGTVWVQQLHAMMKIKDAPRIMVLETMAAASQLLERMSRQTELRRAVTEKDVNRYLRSILDLVSSTSDVEAVCNGLELAAAWCTHFPGPCKSSVGRLKTASVRLLQSPSSLVQQGAARVFAATIDASPPSQLVKRWQESLVQIVVALHQTLDLALENVDEGVSSSRTPRPSMSVLQSSKQRQMEIDVLFHHLPETEPRRTLTLASTCTGLLAAISALLRGVAGDLLVSSPLAEVTGVLNRVLSVDGAMIATCVSNLQERALAASIADIHKHVWHTLQTLIETHKSVLLPLSTAILHAAFKTLQSHVPHPVKSAASGHPYPAVLPCVMDAARSLLVLCTPPLHECSEEMTAIVDTAIALASPRPREKVTLTVKLSKKERRQRNKTNFMAVKSDAPRVGHAVALSALKLLDAVVLRGHVQLDAGTRARLDAWLIGLMEAARFTQSPFDDAQCRAQLYTLLATGLLCPTPQSPVLAHETVAALTNGLHDSSSEVVAACVRGLAAVDPVLRPRHPSVRRPLLVAHGMAAAKRAPPDAADMDTGAEDERAHDMGTHNEADAAQARAASGAEDDDDDAIEAGEKEDEGGQRESVSRGGCGENDAQRGASVVMATHATSADSSIKEREVTAREAPDEDKATTHGDAEDLGEDEQPRKRHRGIHDDNEGGGQALEMQSEQDGEARCEDEGEAVEEEVEATKETVRESSEEEADDNGEGEEGGDSSGSGDDDEDDDEDGDEEEDFSHLLVDAGPDSEEEEQEEQEEGGVQ